MQKYLIVIGAIIILAGLFWSHLIKLPFGKLPGDIIIDRPNFKIFIPITTTLIVSIFLSIVNYLIACS